MRTTIMLSIACTALALASCGKSPGERAAEAAIEQATGQKAQVDADKGEIVMKTEQGEVRMAGGDQATLPKSFPKDVYLPAKYKVESVMESPEVTIVQLDAQGELGPLFDEAGRKMANEGWKQRLSMQQSDDQRVAMYEKANRTATLSLVDDEAAGVKVNVQVQASKQ